MQNTDTATGLKNTVFLTPSRVSQLTGLSEARIESFETNHRLAIKGYSFDKGVDGMWYQMGPSRFADDKPSPLAVQPGGDHYRKYKIQPVEYINANGLSFLAGNIVKYVTRYKDKGGRADIEKIKHYCDLILEFEYKD